ncbi:hypothetical protein HEP87_00955 [Streptomyces sp. S1D4-11]|nr:hypothetical protein [Streptomyces sp. S1D4-11]QIY93053.1 hypothetical protein HEP87_00955 [Streptomyces sp. S1D4-11]
MDGLAVVHEPDPVLLQVPPPGSLAQKVIQVPDRQLSHVLFLSAKSPSG